MKNNEQFNLKFEYEGNPTKPIVAFIDNEGSLWVQVGDVDSGYDNWRVLDKDKDEEEFASYLITAEKTFTKGDVIKITF